MELKTGYCPICDKILTIFSKHIACDCPVCGHYVMLHELED